MSILVGRSDAAALCVAGVTLLCGLALSAYGAQTPAAAVWSAGALCIAAVLTLSIVQAMRRGQAGVDVLALLAIVVGVALSEYLSAAVVALMVASGRALESYAEMRSRRDVTALLRQAPQFANRFEEGEWRTVSLNAVVPGQRLLVRHGELVPVDGSLATDAELDESVLSGESRLQRRRRGDTVRSGVLNAGAPFEMLADATAEKSTFAGIARLVESTLAERSPTSRMADRYAIWFVPSSLLVAGAAWLGSGDPVRALAVLVVATPCPLILAVPVAIVGGMSACARRGVVIKGGGALERLAKASILFFDKTGTLTSGRVRVAGVENAPGRAPGEALRLAASVAQASSHGVAEAVAAAARERGFSLALPAGVTEVPGAGVLGDVEGHRIALGSFDFIATHAATPPWSRAVMRRAAYEGASTAFVSVDGNVAAAFILLDRIRMDAPRALRLLRAAGFRRVGMLTGDQRDVAETVGVLLGVSDVHAGLAPKEKLDIIAAARQNGTVVMVGDGVNDAPALAAADIGMAMGLRGSAASVDAADGVLLVDRLDALADAVRIARRARRIALQSAAAGMSLSLAAMFVAALGYLPPLAGALLQEIIDVLVVANALRTSRRDPQSRAQALSARDADRLQAEHTDLTPILEELRGVADSLPSTDSHVALQALGQLCIRLDAVVLPHEQRDDDTLYPRLAGLLGGTDPLAPMSTTHREIFRVIRLLRSMTTEPLADGLDPFPVGEYQRLLYGLEAVLRLHWEQENEIFDALRADTPRA